MTPLSSVAFDIETTGFATDDKLTVVGFDLELGSRIFLNTGGRASPPGLEQRLTERVEGKVSVSAHVSEGALLEAVREYTESRLRHREVKLVAYNGERWSGGFDLPFLRTRLSQHDTDWLFADLPYVDVMDIYETYFNASENTLEAVYEELIGGGLTEVDPFGESSEGVTAWNNGNFDALLLHNLADIRRTRALIQLAERYCSKSDFSMKSLDPVV